MSYSTLERRRQKSTFLELAPFCMQVVEARRDRRRLAALLREMCDEKRKLNGINIATILQVLRLGLRRGCRT